MNRISLLLTAIAISVTTAGCATKLYGRQEPLRNFQKELMSCRDIDVELAKNAAFIEFVNKESEFSGRDVIAILGDLGIGNNREKTGALDSAKSREDQLRELRVVKKCEPAKV